MSHIIRKERLCPLCHCSQTLTEDLQTCNCACHPLDRNPREQISALQAEIKRLMESGDFQLSERTRLREERDTLKRENAALRQFIDAVESCPSCHWVIKFEGHRTLKALACETCKSIRACEADAAKEKG